jgi:small GTP-binding protein
LQGGVQLTSRSGLRMRCGGRRVCNSPYKPWHSVLKNIPPPGQRKLTWTSVNREQGHRQVFWNPTCDTILTFIRIPFGSLERVRSSSLTLAQLIYSRKLARYRAQLLEPGPGAGGGGGAGFDVSKSGDARIALVGFPSVGKSTFLSKITKTKSEVAAYSFTTLTAIPGVLEYGGAEIQILDLPGIIEGAAEGKGRGRQVISAVKTSDLILMILDATKKAEQRALLEAELEAVGIRLNREPPFVFPDSHSRHQIS